MVTMEHGLLCKFSASLNLSPSDDGSYPAARHSVPSPDGTCIATVQRARLVVRPVTTDGYPQTWDLPQDFVARCAFVKWSHPPKEANGSVDEDQVLSSSRILLADAEIVRVFDINDHKWEATITGAAKNCGKIANVAFGHNHNEVLVFSDFGAKCTIWSLVTSRGVEIRDPKYSVACHGSRPRTGHLALLTRASAQDVLMLLSPGSYEVLKSIELSTVDAQEVKWSRDGHWIAVRDVASAGHKVQIYTADGNLFKTFQGVADTDEIGLGVKCMKWLPSGALMIGDYNNNITILDHRKFTPTTTLRHPSASINIPEISVWEEQIDSVKTRSYKEAVQPANPPTSATSARAATTPKHGISIITQNLDGTLLAARNDASPTTAWIWSLQTGKAVTILIHHSPIKQLSWHPAHSDLLMIHCAIAEPVIHLWRYSWSEPLAIPLPLERASGRIEAHWLRNSHLQSLDVLLSSSMQSIISQVSQAGDLITNEHTTTQVFGASRGGPEDMFDEGNSLDLSPVKLEGTLGYGALNDSGQDFGMTEAIDDTFHYRKQVKAGG